MSRQLPRLLHHSFCHGLTDDRRADLAAVDLLLLDHVYVEPHAAGLKIVVVTLLVISETVIVPYNQRAYAAADDVALDKLARRRVAELHGEWHNHNGIYAGTP